MNKLTAIILLLMATTTYTWGQLYAPEIKIQDTQGNIGIGVSNPTWKFQINGSGNKPLLLVNGDGTEGSNRLIQMSNGAGKEFVMHSNGRIGIGTGSSSLNSQLTSQGSTWQLKMNNGIGDNPWYFGSSESTWHSGTDKFIVSPNGSSNNAFISIRRTGEVGIGTNSPEAGYKLHVNGDLKVNRITTNGRSYWSDFVFANDYTLPSLSSIEKHIRQHKHLPDIPSEAEVKERGYELGDMDARLLQKIEELTLYLIDQEKRLQQVEQTNQQLQQKLQTLTTHD